MNTLLGASALGWREVVRFWRQPGRIVSAVLSPLVFWLVIGSGLSPSFTPQGVERVAFLRYFFPGTVVLLVLFAAIFNTISVIEDRQNGFLQGVLVSPLPRAGLVAGKLLGGALLAWLQGAVVVFLAPWAGISLGGGRAVLALGELFLLSCGLTGLGLAFAFRMRSTQGFHGVMNLLLVPMWLLSGSFFPLAGAPGWLAWLSRLDPLTYGVAAFREALDPGALATPGSTPRWVTPALAIGGFLLALLAAPREER